MTTFTARTKGSALLEVVVGVALVILVSYGIMVVQAQTEKLQRYTEIASASSEALQNESARLHSLPLRAFYTDAAMTSLQPQITYYRVLPIEGRTGFAGTDIYAEVTVSLSPVIGGTGPVRVRVTVQPRYALSTPVPTGTEGIAREASDGNFAPTNGWRPDLTRITESVSFIAL